MERAFNAEYIQQKLQNLEVHVNGVLTTVSTQQVGFRLPGEGKVALEADVVLSKTGDVQHVAFTAVPKIRAVGEQVSLEQVQYPEGELESPELTVALVNSTSELLDLRNFNLEGMSLRLKQLDVQVGKLTLQADAYIEQFPNGTGE